jgi:hypothetical protein
MQRIEVELESGVLAFYKASFSGRVEDAHVEVTPT